MSCKTDDMKALCTGTASGLNRIAPGVFELMVEGNIPLPASGQFFMIRSANSKQLLCRPISVYRKESLPSGRTRIHFLILEKGRGTSELVNLKHGEKVELVGPLGNTFEAPADNKKLIAIVGGGIGVAPVAGFAETLPAGSYDFFASFKSGCYGIDHLQPATTYITTDDGSVGIHGMITAAFTVDLLKKKNYAAVYACGPEPMLAYIQKTCAEAGVQCYLSMEARMACGVGACLGCTIVTTEGNRRCCKDGPVFAGEKLIFPQRAPKARPECRITEPVEGSAPDLSVTIAGVHFQNPVIAASGTYGYGSEFNGLTDTDGLGGICSKGLTLQPKAGNTGIRLIETPSGLINSIGLENPGIEHFIAHELPDMLKFKATTIANLSGSTLETYVEGARLLDATDVPMIELNISCPNVKAGGMAWGLDPAAATEVTSAVRAVTKKPLMVKLSPNAPNLIAVADAVRTAGADAISLVNTFQGTAIDIERAEPYFDNIRAGFSGPAVKPIALRMVYDLCQHMNTLPEAERVPVVGLGGISCWQDAVEFIMAGASAVQVGTATFANPRTMNDIAEGLAAFMARKGYPTIESMRGLALR